MDVRLVDRQHTATLLQPAARWKPALKCRI